MTNQKLLIPLRVPELGPFMGKVVTGSGVIPGGLGLDSIRNRLATRIFEAGGEARRLGAREERQAAVHAIGRTVWLEAWDDAVTGVASLLAERVRGRLAAEAWAVRLPRRKRRRMLPDEREQRAIAARLGSAGATLIPVLDEIEIRGEAALDATALERDAIEAWHDALRTAARRLEAAWLDLEDAITIESGRWERLAQKIACWRKPLWPVAVLGMPILAAAIWFGLVLGGHVESPEWLSALWQQVGGR